MKRSKALLLELGITDRLLAARRLPVFREVRHLEPAGLGSDGRDKFLTPAAARAWRAMQERAQTDGVLLQLVSGFRSIEFQATLLRQKRAKGIALEEILRINAPPGYSEHHTGRAVDIGTRDCPPLDEAFERTEAFRWLGIKARRFDFSMSYPRGNRQGFIYEPWHWRYK